MSWHIQWFEPTGEEIHEGCEGCSICRREGGWCRSYHPLRNVVTGEVFKDWDNLPIGALMDCNWLHNSAKPEAYFTDKDATWKANHFCVRMSADGRVLRVKTPGGDWLIDQISTQGNFWTRTGDPTRPETFSASPSINIVGQYHGWLTQGILSDDCEGRRFA